MESNRDKFYGGVEGGGTKFIAAVGTGPDDLVAMTRIETTTPSETIGKVIDFFRGEREKRRLEAIGVASMGPLDLDSNSPTFGFITTSPKEGWAFTDIHGEIHRALNVPVALDTDVNGAAVGEGKWGAARGLDTYIYVTVGTGIGGGAVVDGKPLHGLLHPEMGHISVPHDFTRDLFPGSCPFHGNCLEGLASGTAMAERWERPTEAIPAGHEAWELEADYLAAGLVNFIVTLSPQRIIIGGGIMKHTALLPMIRSRVLKLLNDYVKSPEITERIESYIVPPGLGDLSGVLGAIALAETMTRGN